MPDGPLAVFGFSSDDALQRFVVPLTTKRGISFLINRALHEIQSQAGSVEKVLEVVDHIEGQVAPTAIATLRWHAARMTLAQAELLRTYEFRTKVWVDYKKRPAWSPGLNAEFSAMGSLRS